MSAAGCLMPGFHHQFGVFDFIRKRSESRRVLVDNEETSDTQVEQSATPSVLSCENCTLHNSPLLKQPSPLVSIFRALALTNTNCTDIHYIRHTDSGDCTILEATPGKSLCNSTDTDLVDGCCSGNICMVHCRNDRHTSNGRTILSTADRNINLCRSVDRHLCRRNVDMDKVVRSRSEGNFDLIKSCRDTLMSDFLIEHEMKNSGDTTTASAVNWSTDRECNVDAITHAGGNVKHDELEADAKQDDSYGDLAHARDNVPGGAYSCEENQKLIPKSIHSDEDPVLNIKASKSEPVSLQSAARNVLSLPTKLGTHYVEKTAKERKSKLREVARLFKAKSETDNIEMETLTMPDDKDTDNKSELTSFIQGKDEDSGSLKSRWRKFRSEKSCKIEPETTSRMSDKQCLGSSWSIAAGRSFSNNKMTASVIGEPNMETIQKYASPLSVSSNNLAETSDVLSTCEGVIQRPTTLFTKTSECDLQGFLATPIESTEVLDVQEASMLICTEHKEDNNVTTASKLKLYFSGKTASTEDMGSEGMRKARTGKRSQMKSYHSQPELRPSQVEHRSGVPVLCRKSSPEYIVKEPVIKKSPQSCEQNAPLLRLKTRLFKQKSPLLAGGKLKFNISPPSLATRAPYKVKVNTPKLKP
ncbi:uncharacterized protein LOC144880793 isoform X1 [Branchiostoma floridae x Branchiostoma japonicum]|uniref:Uncharacterized protein n=1 Tax=Branchiostoma floridae TaxID=7739 RepID=C3Y1I5_BRAFL|eukprot:XP_002609715.1 hypothetical protein BRAFLDRAFT_102473 [Branchiostoma floridae]